MKSVLGRLMRDYCDSKGIAWQRSTASRDASPFSSILARLPEAYPGPIANNFFVNNKQLPQPPTETSSQTMRRFTAAKVLYVLLR